VEVAHISLEKVEVLSAGNDVFQTKTCSSSYLLEPPKFDMRKAYEFTMRNQDYSGRTANLKRGCRVHTSIEKKKILTLQFL
jgi:hypothetical protein